MSRRIDQPQPGFFAMRLVKGGVEVAARIFRQCHCTVNGGPDNAPHDWMESCDRFPHLEGEINGRPAGVDRIWTSGRQIDFAEWAFLNDDRAWCREHAPDAPEAKPDEPVNIKAMRPIF